MRIDVWIFLGLMILILMYSVYMSNENQLKCIISSKDGKTYCVRERSKMELAANLLADTTDRMKKIVAYMKRTHPEDARTKRLVERFNPAAISETLPTSLLTAYSENKGEKMAFCLNKQNTEKSKLIDTHTLTFVALHELTHVMTEETGHPRIFWQNFKFLLENAKDAGIHQPIDYKTDPTTYCGMKITDNPYFDLSM